jgi:hypothetical protein
MVQAVTTPIDHRGACAEFISVSHFVHRQIIDLAFLLLLSLVLPLLRVLHQLRFVHLRSQVKNTCQGKKFYDFQPHHLQHKNLF